MSLSLLTPLKLCKNLITQPLNLTKFTFARQASSCRGSWPPNQPCRPGFNRNQQQRPPPPKAQQSKKPACSLSDLWRPPNLCRDPCKKENPWQAPQGCKSTDPLKQHVPCNPPRPDQCPPPKVPGCCANRFPCYDPCSKDPPSTYPQTPWTSSRPTTWTPTPCHAALNAARYSAKASGSSGGGCGRGANLSSPCKPPCSNQRPPCPPQGSKPCGGGPSDPPEGPCNLPHIQASQDPPDPCRIPYYYLDPCDPDIVPKDPCGGKPSCGGEPPTCPTCPTCPNCVNCSSNKNPNLWSQETCRRVLRDPCPCNQPPECCDRGIELYSDVDSDFASATSVLMFLAATTYFISTWNCDEDRDDS